MSQEIERDLKEAYESLHRLIKKNHGREHTAKSKAWYEEKKQFWWHQIAALEQELLEQELKN